jgi:hypothetical protein
MDIAKPVCLFAVECRIHDMGAFDRLELLAGIPAKVACFGRDQSRHDGQMSMVQEFVRRTKLEGKYWALFQMFSRYTLRDQLESERFDLSYTLTHRTA